MSAEIPTPQTQALWREHVHFANEEEATEALCDFRDLCAKLERENIKLSAEARQAVGVHTTNIALALCANRDIAITPGAKRGSVELTHRLGEGGGFPAGDVAAVLITGGDLNAYFSKAF